MAIEGILRTGFAAQLSQTNAVKPLILWESPHPLSIVRVFYATSESAVAIQVTVALIAFVLLKLAHAAQGAVESLTQFARLVGAMLMQQTSIDSLRGQHAMLLVPPVQLHAQGVLPWA